MAFMAAFFFITFIAFMAAFFFITFMAFMAAFFFITFGLHGCFLLHHLHGLHGCLLLHHLWRRCRLHGLHCLCHSNVEGSKACTRMGGVAATAGLEPKVMK